MAFISFLYKIIPEASGFTGMATDSNGESRTGNTFTAKSSINRNLAGEGVINGATGFTLLTSPVVSESSFGGAFGGTKSFTNGTIEAVDFSFPRGSFTVTRSTTGSAVFQNTGRDTDDTDKIITRTDSGSFSDSKTSESTLSYYRMTTGYGPSITDVAELPNSSTTTTEGSITVNNSVFTFKENTTEPTTDTVTITKSRHFYDFFSVNPYTESLREYVIQYPKPGYLLLTADTSILSGTTSALFSISNSTDSFSFWKSFGGDKVMTRITNSDKTVNQETRTSEYNGFFTKNDFSFRLFANPFVNNQPTITSEFTFIGFTFTKTTRLETTYGIKNIVDSDREYPSSSFAYINTKEEKVYNDCSLDWGANSSKFDPEYTGEFSKVREAFVFSRSDTYLPILFPKEVNRGGFKINFPNDVDGNITASNGADTFTGSYKFENNNLFTSSVTKRAKNVDFTNGTYDDPFLRSLYRYNHWSNLSNLNSEFKFLGIFKENNSFNNFNSDVGILNSKYHDEEFTTYTITERNITNSRTNTMVFTDNSTESFVMVTGAGSVTSSKTVEASSIMGYADYRLIITYETDSFSGTVSDSTHSVAALSYEFPIGGLKAQENKFNV